MLHAQELIWTSKNQGNWPLKPLVAEITTTAKMSG